MPTEIHLQKMKSFFVKYPDVFKFYLEHHCEVEVGELLQFHRYLNIKNICYRPHSWTLDILEKYKDLLDWEGICWTGKFSDEAEFLKTFSDFIVWQNLSENESFNWSVDLLSAYYFRLNWAKLSRNKSLKLNKEIIFQFQAYWDHNAILLREDVPWDDELLNFCIKSIDINEEFSSVAFPTFGALKMYLWNHRFDKEYCRLHKKLFIEDPGPGFCAEVFGSLEPIVADSDIYDTGTAENRRLLIRAVDEDRLY